MDLSKLCEPFPLDAIEFRLQSAGERNGKVWALCIVYVDARAIMDRLDEVCGPAHWRNEFREGPGGGVLCGISIRLPLHSGVDTATGEVLMHGHEWVTKWDGAENTDIEGVKGGLSGAMKRAAVQWGIGRFLYQIDESFAEIADNGTHRGKTKEGKAFRWNPPALPAWALPSAPQPHQPPSAPQPSPAPGSRESAALRYIREIGPRAPEDALVMHAGEAHPLREYVRERWLEIKERPSMAQTVVNAIEAATGTPFKPEEYE